MTQITVFPRFPQQNSPRKQAKRSPRDIPKKHKSYKSYKSRDMSPQNVPNFPSKRPKLRPCRPSRLSSARRYKSSASARRPFSFNSPAKLAVLAAVTSARAGLGPKTKPTPLRCFLGQNMPKISTAHDRLTPFYPYSSSPDWFESQRRFSTSFGPKAQVKSATFSACSPSDIMGGTQMSFMTDQHPSIQGFRLLQLAQHLVHEGQIRHLRSTRNVSSEHPDIFRHCHQNSQHIAGFWFHRNLVMLGSLLPHPILFKAQLGGSPSGQVQGRIGVTG